MGTPVILYSRRHWSPGQRAAAGGAVLASLLLPWWLAMPHAPSAVTSTAPPLPPAYRAASPPREDPPWPVARRSDARAHRVPAHAAAPSASVGALPYRYVGQWTEGPVTAVVLGERGVSFVVRVPGPVDARYDARSVDDHRVVLWDRVLQRDVELALSAPPGTDVPPTRGVARPAPVALAPAVSPPSDAEPEN